MQAVAKAAVAKAVEQAPGVASKAIALGQAAASATAVKSTQAVMSCSPILAKGSPWARWRKWHSNVPSVRSG